ncbi:peptide ABC transporter substrate-binding protein [Roseibium sp. Sym1]|uniref:peptide ABC transporter substrate-binding protein n=1 Tax=Roseibium sp. Sym1 TaxID=3016006 RepID=UPI0022B4FAFF|nr:peptide ABC transporter substrate-binding protein [Roseibium sp. Sym1]
MKTVLRIALLSLVWTGLLSGVAAATGSHPATGEPLADNQTFTYRIPSEPTSLDPQLASDVAGRDIIRDLFEGLFNQDENGDLVPGVATGYDLSGDKRTYRFRLRDTARWSNGDPVTAQDFVYAWRRAADPATNAPYQWFIELMSLENVDAITSGQKPVEALGVTAVDDHTLEVRLSTPLPYFPQMTVHTVTFPVPREAVETFGAAWTHPENIVSNGAYTLESHETDARSVRVRNPLYWDSAETILDRVVARVVPDENEGVTLFLAGEVDRTDVPAGFYERIRQNYPDETVSFPRLCNYYLVFNMSASAPEALQDRRVRQALSLAIDRRVITDEILAGGQREAYSFTPTEVAGFDPPETELAVLSQTERDNKARTLIAEAGYGTGGEPLAFNYLYNSSSAHKKIAEAIARMWQTKLGVEARIGELEWNDFLKVRSRQDFHMARGAWCGDYNEASTFLDLLGEDSGYNDGKYANPDVSRLLKQARTAPEAGPLYTEIEKILADDVPVIPVYDYSGSYLLKSNVENWPVRNAQQNWYSKNLYRTPR